MLDRLTFGMTHSYVNTRYPFQLIYERMMREFQALLQVIAVEAIDDGYAKLGISHANYLALLSEAHRTGMGISCIDPKSGIQPNSVEGEDCKELQNCPSCGNRFIIATVENLTDIILWNHHLKQNNDDWSQDRPERWEKVWLPWLAFTEVAIEMASRGRTLPNFIKASSIAQKLIEEEKINLPPLW